MKLKVFIFKICILLSLPLFAATLDTLALVNKSQSCEKLLSSSSSTNSSNVIIFQEGYSITSNGPQDHSRIIYVEKGVNIGGRRTNVGHRILLATGEEDTIALSFLLKQRISISNFPDLSIVLKESVTNQDVQNLIKTIEALKLNSQPTFRYIEIAQFLSAQGIHSKDFLTVLKAIQNSPLVEEVRFAETYFANAQGQEPVNIVYGSYIEIPIGGKIDPDSYRLLTKPFGFKSIIPEDLQ